MSEYAWPPAECLHEHKQNQEAVMTFASEKPIDIIPAWCPECGYTWPIDSTDL